MIKLLKFFFPLTMADYADEIRAEYCKKLSESGAFSVKPPTVTYWGCCQTTAVPPANLGVTTSTLSEEQYKKYLREL